jgi:cell division protein FtsQ
VVGVALTAALVAGGYFAWFRNSSLVAVTRVEVSGLSSPDAPRIEEALTEAATSMTTLNVDQKLLDRAVAPFPTVISVSADPDLPHGLAIDVSERPPALIAEAKDESVPVGPDGVLLEGLELGDAADALPVLQVEELPGSGKLAGDALEQAVVLGAAPAPLRPLIEGVAIAGERGVEVTMRGGIPIRFGSSELAARKWAAAAAVLADPKTETLTYVDVRVPERPALGGAEAPPAPDPVDPAVDPAATAVDPAAAAPVDPAVTTEPVEPTL